ncbi:Nitrogen regulatory protein P-II-like protein, partial [Dichanthelium oligosanthes]
MPFTYFHFPAFNRLEKSPRGQERAESTEAETSHQTSPERRTTTEDYSMSPATSVAVVSVPGVLIRQSPSTLGPFPTARRLPSGAARPLQVTSASRRLRATAARAQSAAEPGQEPFHPAHNYILMPPFGSFVPKSSRADWIAAADCAASVGRCQGTRLNRISTRPWRVPHVSSGLLEMGIRGVTVSDVRGFGAQGGSTERHGGSEFLEDTFISKVKIEIVVCKEQVEAVVDKIIEKARTGEIGDGKIF